MKRHHYVVSFLSLLVAALYILLSNFYSFPWQDEIYTADTAANFVLYGNWHSSIWRYTYPPLYGLLQVVWFFLFGISHVSVCSLEIILALICFLLIVRILFKREILKKAISIYLFFVLYWFGFYFPTIFTMGRMDMLVMLFSILLVDKLVDTDKGKKTNCLIALYAALASLTALYELPALAAFSAFLFFSAGKDSRKEYFVRGLCVAIGMAIGLCGTAAFSIINHTLHRSVAEMSYLNQNFVEEKTTLLNRIFDGYFDIHSMVLVAIGFVLTCVSKSRRAFGYYPLFFVLLPLIMVLAGRYEWYYSWMVYVPVIIYLSMVLDRLDSPKLRISVFGIVAICSVSYCLIMSQYPERYEHDLDVMRKDVSLKDCRDDVKLAAHIAQNLDRYSEGCDSIFFVSHYFYYPLVDRSLVLISVWSGFFENYIYCDRGVFLAINSDEAEDFVRFCKSHDYRCTPHPCALGASEGAIIPFQKVD